MRPILAAGAAIGCAQTVHRFIPALPNTAVMVIQSVVLMTVYGLLLPTLRCFTRAEWRDVTKKKAAVD